MDKKEIANKIKQLKESSPKKNFKQSIDLIINLKNLDLKKPDNQIDHFIYLHYPLHKTVKICALVGPELHEQAKNELDEAILVDEFQDYIKNKSNAKKLARKYDLFIAQASIMTKIAQAFGKILGPLNKMPNPKAGCVVPPNVNLSQLKTRLQTQVRLKVKSNLSIQIAVGYEDSNEEIVIDNIKTIYDQLIHFLPNEKNNIKNIMLKFTMGKPVKFGDSEANVSEEKTNKRKK
jgi:large subunit ribosomal protein L1